MWIHRQLPIRFLVDDNVVFTSGRILMSGRIDELCRTKAFIFLDAATIAQLKITTLSIAYNRLRLR